MIRSTRQTTKRTPLSPREKSRPTRQSNSPCGAWPFPEVRIPRPGRSTARQPRDVQRRNDEAGAGFRRPHPRIEPPLSMAMHLHLGARSHRRHPRPHRRLERSLRTLHLDQERRRNPRPRHAPSEDVNHETLARRVRWPKISNVVRLRTLCGLDFFRALCECADESLPYLQHVAVAVANPRWLRAPRELARPNA